MSKFFNITMLPGREGDCIWIEYGDTADKTHRILIDGGRQIAYESIKQRFEDIPEDERVLDLLVLTHVDADHIEGLLEMFEDKSLNISFNDVWFNGYDHLTPPTDGQDYETLGAKQGEKFTTGLLRKKWGWNVAFDGASVVVPDDGDLPVKTLPGGMKITLISPYWDGLKKFRKAWLKECKAAGIIPGTDARRDEISNLTLFETFGGISKTLVGRLLKAKQKYDSRPANGSSIAFIAEYDRKSALLTGDAHIRPMIKSLEKLDSPIRVNAFKLSHHGSKGTTSKELLSMVQFEKALISSDGSRYNHPDKETMAMLIDSQTEQVEVIGNYQSEELMAWDIDSLKSEFNYSILAPDDNEQLTIEL